MSSSAVASTRFRVAVMNRARASIKPDPRITELPNDKPIAQSSPCPLPQDILFGNQPRTREATQRYRVVVCRTRYRDLAIDWRNRQDLCITTTFVKVMDSSSGGADASATQYAR